jgi:hypothetical protein
MSLQPIPQYEAQLQFRFLEDVLSSSVTQIKVDVLPTETAGYCSVFDLSGNFVTKFKWNGIDTAQKRLIGIVWGLSSTGATDTAGTFVPVYQNYTGFYIPENLLLNKIIRFLNGEESFNINNLRSQHDATAGDQYVRLSQVVALVSGGNISLEQLVVTGQQALAGEALASGVAVYFNETTQRWLRTTAGTPSTVTNVILGITNGSGTINNPVTNGITIYGTLYNLTGLTPGARYYLSDTLGQISTTPGTLRVFIGVASTSTRFVFNPAYPVLPTFDEKDALKGSFGNPTDSNRYVTRQDTSGGGTRTDNTISFTASTKTIGDTGNGLGVFNVGEQIVVTGSASNNGTYTIKSVTPSAIVVNETLVNETAGATVTITSPLVGRLVRTTTSGVLPASSIPQLPNFSEVVTYPLGENITVGATPMPVMILNTSDPLHRCQSFLGSSFNTITITPNNFVGQTFTTGSTTTRLRFIRYIHGFGNYSSNITQFRARLFATSGGLPTGPAIAEAKPYTEVIPAGGGGIFNATSFNTPWYTESDLNFFDFGEVTVTPNTQYAIIFSVDGTGSFLDIPVSTSNPYSGGTLVTAPSLLGPWTTSSSDDIPLDIFEYDNSNNFIVVRARTPFNSDFNYRRSGSSAGTLPTFPMWGCDGFITQSGSAGDLRQVTISGNLSGFSGLTQNEEYYVNGVGTIALGNTSPRVGIAINSTTLRLYPSTKITVATAFPIRLLIPQAGGSSSYTYFKRVYTMYSKYLTSRPIVNSTGTLFAVGASASNSTGNYLGITGIFLLGINYTSAVGTHTANHLASDYSLEVTYMH